VAADVGGTKTYYTRNLLEFKKMDFTTNIVENDKSVCMECAEPLQQTMRMLIQRA
jgi:hypothetical protein